ncbi:MAG: hypothetical protein LBB51_01515 [Zoogloeaceae bacterium]|jgi:hypothetical protein|nr:hypothetical protein [Zoogloeaceae bacterium]
MSQSLSISGVSLSDDALGVLQTASVLEEVRQDVLPLIFGLGCALCMLLLGGLWWSLGQTSEAHGAPVIFPTFKHPVQQEEPAAPVLYPPQAADTGAVFVPEDVAQPDAGLMTVPEEVAQPDADLASAPEESAQPDTDLVLVPAPVLVPEKSVSVAPKATPRAAPKAAPKGNSAWYGARPESPQRQKARKAPRATPAPQGEPKWLRDWRHLG